MEANIINVGNSKGIIIPSKFLKLLGLHKKVNIDIEEDKIVIKQASKTIRKDWDELFVKANSMDETEILIPDVFEDESFEEWTW